MEKKCIQCGSILKPYEKIGYSCYCNNTLSDTQDSKNTTNCEETSRSQGYYCERCNKFFPEEK